MDTGSVLSAVPGIHWGLGTYSPQIRGDCYSRYSVLGGLLLLSR